MSSVDIDSRGVIQLILQYLQENNLTESYNTLAKETRVTTNLLSNKELFLSSVISGKWDYVLQQISTLTLPKSVLMDLYEQIFYELLEIREMYTANELLTQCDPLVMMKTEKEERYLQMEYWLKKSYFDPVEAYPAGETKETRRQKLASVISSYITVAPSSRLLTLLQEALSYEKEHGLLPEGEQLDVFRNVVETVVLEDAVPTVKGTVIQFPKGSYAEVACVSPNGQYFVTGSVDGLIEVWDLEKGVIRSELVYQKEEKFMAHAKSVLSLAFSGDSEFLASGDLEGTIKIWRVRNGGLLRRFSCVHEAGVTSLCFNVNNQQVCSGSFDGTVRIHGLKSGKTLKTFQGHQSYVNSVRFTADQHSVISASSDGTVRRWEVSSGRCDRTLSPARAIGSFADISVMLAEPLPQDPERLFVVPRFHEAFIMTMSGDVVYRLPTSKEEVQFTGGCVSPHGKYVYGVSEDGDRYCFRAEDGELEEKRKMATHELLGVLHFPTGNRMVTYSQKGEVTEWRT
ncbi:hypothetical protein WA588_006495 [Blastocystis sp. NMH]